MYLLLHLLLEKFKKLSKTFITTLDIEARRLNNIKDNEDFARQLGLPVSKRKFDRHVPRVTQYSEDDDEDQVVVEEQRDLLNGEQVYLLHNNKPLFKAKFEETDSSNNTVHGKK